MHRVTLQPSGLQFEVEDGETVLAAALRQGYVLPYGCRNGACGSCKGTVLSGELDYGVYQKKALPDEERARGKALFCQAKPLGDLTIEARTVGAAKDIEVKKLPCRVQKMERLADDVMVLSLKLPANERLQFLAGQYLEFLLKDGSRRSFSMANAPHDDELLQLHVRHVAGGQFTDHVFGKMKERDILRMEGPLGTFFLREDSEKPIVLVASGTGFAPIKAIIEHAFHKGIARPMTLYWGGRRPKDLYMDALANGWAARHAPQFKYVPVISEALPEDAWRGRTGFVHRAVMEDFPELSGYQVYACGVPIMVDSARRDFVQVCKLPETEFYADSFTTQADLAAPAQPAVVAPASSPR
ncbi:MAG: CDP-6-deoxy-delta-3,4-glucoseen reductase [Betaproteobacteria bacterium]|nr:CDP-6-deoxy-delta-3,4-glucoseen reductase [Betaproteobacteria bacterium]